LLESGFTGLWDFQDSSGARIRVRFGGDSGYGEKRGLDERNPENPANPENPDSDKTRAKQLTTSH